VNDHDAAGLETRPQPFTIAGEKSRIDGFVAHDLISRELPCAGNEDFG
jgi:hypothetical protein